MAKRKMPVRTRVIQLDGDWEGWQFTARINPPLEALSALAGNFESYSTALKEIVLDWNFVDEEGRPMEPSEDGTYPVGRLPADLYRVMSDRVLEEATKLPPE